MYLLSNVCRYGESSLFEALTVCGPCMFIYYSRTDASLQREITVPLHNGANRNIRSRDWSNDMFPPRRLTLASSALSRSRIIKRFHRLRVPGIARPGRGWNRGPWESGRVISRHGQIASANSFGGPLRYPFHPYPPSKETRRKRFAQSHAGNTACKYRRRRRRSSLVLQGGIRDRGSERTQSNCRRLQAS